MNHILCHRYALHNDRFTTSFFNTLAPLWKSHLNFHNIWDCVIQAQPLGDLSYDAVAGGWVWHTGGGVALPVTNLLNSFITTVTAIITITILLVQKQKLDLCFDHHKFCHPDSREIYCYIFTIPPLSSFPPPSPPSPLPSGWTKKRVFRKFS